jgi:hypothetical protein
MPVSSHLVKNAMDDCRRRQLREQAIERPKMPKLTKLSWLWPRSGSQVNEVFPAILILSV